MPALVENAAEAVVSVAAEAGGAVRLRGSVRAMRAVAGHVVTSARTVEVITGPATGKTRVLGHRGPDLGRPGGRHRHFRNATNELRAADIRIAENTTSLLADHQRGRIPPGSLIAADEGSIISITHLAALTEYAAGNGCKLVLAGDQEQLAAVGGGGAMMLLADRLGTSSSPSIVRARLEARPLTRGRA